MKTFPIFTLLTCLLSMSVDASQSRFDILEFTPTVTIHKQTNSNAIQVITESNYTGTYNMANHTFDPILMDFQVVSTGDLPESHTFNLIFHEHYCKEEGGSVETPIENVELYIGGQNTFDGYSYNVTTETTNHTLQVDIPFVRPAYVEQTCYGIIGFTLKLDSL